jgi:cob(I)alamin adenosyltransferase
MPPSIATRTGDNGSTSLLYGQRVSKDHPQIESVGTLDELNAALGLAKVTGSNPEDKTWIECIQKDLISMMGEVACDQEDVARYERSSFPKISDADLARIDAQVAALEARHIVFAGWATPGANVYAGNLDVARTIARRSERRLVGLSRGGRKLRPVLIQYLNRVADLLWLLARKAEPQDLKPATPGR